jgi:serine protease
MHRFAPRLIAYLATIAVTGCAAGVTAPPNGPAAGALAPNAYAMQPQYMPSRSAEARGVVPDAGTSGIPYLGGPVLLHPKVYLIFWGYKKYGDPDGVAKLLTDFAGAMGDSGHNNIYTQYYDVVDGQTNYITNPRQQLGGVWFDDKNEVPHNPTDAEVAQEALNGVARLGYDVNGSYVVATPHDHSTAGFDTQWCAYHSDTYNGGNLVSYTNLPYMPDAGDNCGANFITPPKDESGTDEGVTIVEGHEYGDSVTDPVPKTAWYPEIGSLCAWFDVANDRFRKQSYTMQPMFSNASLSCVQTYAGAL